MRVKRYAVIGYDLAGKVVGESINVPKSAIARAVKVASGGRAAYATIHAMWPDHTGWHAHPLGVAARRGRGYKVVIARGL